jgi:hypothetical protein
MMPVMREKERTLKTGTLVLNPSTERRRRATDTASP